VIPSSITNIGRSAFEVCASLKEIIIPESVKKIGANAFAHCASLKKVILPGNTVVEKNAFYGCKNLPEEFRSNIKTTKGCKELTQGEAAPDRVDIPKEQLALTNKEKGIIKKALKEADLSSKYKEYLLIFEEFKSKTLMPSLLLKHKRKKGIKITDSKFGGKPYLPKGFTYPSTKGGEPLKLLAQLNFGELPHIPNFPKEGILQFFILPDEFYSYGSDVPDGYRVIYHKKIGNEIAGDIPDIKCGERTFPFEGEFAITATEEYCLMNTSDGRFGNVFINIYEKYFDVEGEWFDLDDGIIDEPIMEQLASSQPYLDLDKDSFFYGTGHRIGGNPYFCQDGEWSEEQKDDILLFQMDSFGGIEDHPDDITWGDAGQGNFFISMEKLKALDFSDVWYCYDCS
jgi:uncharacterized protein YwqG